jgi:hypothetical protein
MEGYCSVGQSPWWAVVPMEEEDTLKILTVVFGEQTMGQAAV